MVKSPGVLPRKQLVVRNLESLEGENTSLSPFQTILKFPGSVGFSRLPTMHEKQLMPCWVSPVLLLLTVKFKD